MTMAKVLQGNLNRSYTAQILLPQIADELNADILILSEQYRDKTIPTWFSSLSATAAIWIRGASGNQISEHGAGDDFVWVKVGAITYFSVYLTPNCTVGDFENRLSLLEDALRTRQGHVVVAGDFNARAIEWGMTMTNKRGRLLLEMAARLDLVVANTGNTPTYRRPGYGDSIPDVTFTTDGIYSRIKQWRVVEGYNASDHQFIAFEVVDDPTYKKRNTPQPARWNFKKLDKDKFLERLMLAPAPKEMIPDGLTGQQRTDRIVTETGKLLTRLCNETMPLKRHRDKRPQQYWWTDEIANLRKDCLAHKRKLARAKGGVEAEAHRAAYSAARKTLTMTIKDSKKRCWRELCDEVDREPWGTGYKIVTGKLGARTPPAVKDPSTARRIVSGLFPSHETMTEEQVEDDGLEIPLFTEAELYKATSSMKSGKAPGPDGIPAEILRLTGNHRPEILLDMFNACLTTGTFSGRWKTARLVLISKGKGDADLPSSYRPLSLLDTTGKLYEQLLRPRLMDAIKTAGDLSDRQYGFRKGRSTIGAIGKVVDAFKRTELQCHLARSVVLVALLDIQNAFNSARWVDIVKAFEDDFRVPAYLLRVIRDYLRDRFITYETTEGLVTIKVTAGVAQGSILGPDFWNGVYDSLLKLEMPPDTFLTAYADDVAVVIVESNPSLAQLRLNQVMRRVERWMSEHGLRLATSKTELMFMTRKRIPTIMPMTVGTNLIESKNEVKYLGVTLDTKLTFWPHIRRAAEKAAERVTSLSRLMANTRGPRPGKRRLLMTTAHSILLYGAEIWAGALKVKKYAKIMTNVQRQGALRIASAYRTVSEGAVLVVAGVIPIDLLAFERSRIYRRSAETGRQDAAIRERDVTLREWQTRWTNETKGTWTKRLIPKIRPWVGREFGEVNFYLTQFLTGHGYFRRYLNNMGKVRTKDCLYCGHDNDDAEHTFFNCEQWTDLRQRLEATEGALTPDNIIGVMLRSDESWTRVSTFVERILRGKNEDGCLRN